jgi:hypothetical protein
MVSLTHDTKDVGVSAQQQMKRLPRKGDTVIFKGKEAVVLELENDGNMAMKIYVQDNQKKSMANN